MPNLAWWCQVSRRTESHLEGGKFEEADGPLQRPGSSHKLGVPCVCMSVCGPVEEPSAFLSQFDLGVDPLCFLQMSLFSFRCLYESSFLASCCIDEQVENVIQNCFYDKEFYLESSFLHLDRTPC